MTLSDREGRFKLKQILICHELHEFAAREESKEKFVLIRAWRFVAEILFPIMSNQPY